MKLPAEGMKPSDVTSHFENYRQHPVDTNGGGEPVPTMNGGEPVQGFRVESPADLGAPNFPGGEPDFAEFLWMENEEEFDRQVLHELEEQEVINYYFDIYQESLQAEANGQEFPFAHLLGAPGLGNGVARPTSTAPGSSVVNGCNIQSNSAYSSGGRRSNGEDLSSSFSRVLNFRSTLNPNAPEFVPRNFSNNQQDKHTPPPSS